MDELWQIGVHGDIGWIQVAGGVGQGSHAIQRYDPAGIFVDAAGKVFVCDLSNNRVEKWYPGAANGITVAGGNGAG